MSLKEKEKLNLNDYSLSKLEQKEQDNIGIIGKNNFNEIVSKTDLSNLENKKNLLLH